MTMNMKIVCGVTVLALVGGVAYAYVYPQNPVPQGPPKTDFGTNVPTDFPTDIPIEDGVKVSQSYSLDYVGQKQLTIVFQSAKTVKQNYGIYSDFLKKENWDITQKYESESVSSLYGVKEANEINITISANGSGATTGSQVSISVLQK